MSHQSGWVQPSDLGESVVDVGVHKAPLVSVLGHPQDLGGHGRERWDGDVHVVPGGHGEQGGDLGVQAVETSGLWSQAHRRGHTEVSLRTESGSTLVSWRHVWSGVTCSEVPPTFVWSSRSPSGVFSECEVCPFFSHPPLWSLKWLKNSKHMIQFSRINYWSPLASTVPWIKWTTSTVSLAPNNRQQQFDSLSDAA